MSLRENGNTKHHDYPEMKVKAKIIQLPEESVEKHLCHPVEVKDFSEMTQMHSVYKTCGMGTQLSPLNCKVPSSIPISGRTGVPTQAVRPNTGLLAPARHCLKSNWLSLSASRIQPGSFLVIKLS
jgi:hypothetical protein